MPGERGAEDVTDVAVGTMIAGRYRVDSLLGEGGMARVFVATKIGDEATVVIKIPRRVSDTATARFQREVEAVSRLTHPAIVRVLEAGIDPVLGSPFMVMERVEGRSLSELVKAGGPLDEAEARRVLAEIALGLAAAHDEAVLHRDLTPGNVMLDQGGRARILDFGLAKLLVGERGPPLTQPLTTLGTPAFMSPEQITGKALDHRSDLYALGCLAYYVLTARLPFEGKEVIEVMRAHLDLPPPSLPALLADGRPPSAELIGILESLLAKAPADRPADARAVAERLSGRGLGAGRPSIITEDEIRTHFLPRSRLDDLTAVLPKDLEAQENDTTSGAATRLIEAKRPNDGKEPTVIAEAKAGAWMLKATIGLVAGAMAIAIGTWVLLQPPAPSPGAKVEPTAPPQREAPTIVPKEPPPTLRLVSDPTGAEVFDRDRRIGTTPLSLDASLLPLDLVLRHEGRSSVSVRVDHPGDVVVALPLAVRPVSTREPPSPKKIVRPPPPVAPSDEVPVW